jgi:hypothetical protein
VTLGCVEERPGAGVGRLKLLGRVLLDYCELVLAGALAAVVTVLALLDEISTKTLIQATVLLLVAIAIAIIRERLERKAMSDRVEAAVRLASADKPWQVLDETLVWDLADATGALATATTKKELQFMQDEVLSVYEYQYAPQGVVRSHSCKGGGKGEPMVKLPIIQTDFPGPDARVYRLISLQRVWRRGEIMIFESERVLEDHFRDRAERVSKEVGVPTARVSMRVVFPPGRRPTGLWIERTDRPPRNIALRHLRRAGGNRTSYEEVLQDTKVGERITLRWDW